MENDKSCYVIGMLSNKFYASIPVVLDCTSTMRLGAESWFDTVKELCANLCIKKHCSTMTRIARFQKSALDIRVQHDASQNANLA